MGKYQASPHSIKTLNRVKERGARAKFKRRREEKKEERKKKKKSPREEPLAGAPPPTTPETTKVKLGVPPTKPSREPLPEKAAVAGKTPQRSPPELHSTVGSPTFEPPSGQPVPSPTKPPPPSRSPHSREQDLATTRRRRRPPSPENSPQIPYRSSAKQEHRRLLGLRPADRSHLRPHHCLHSIRFVVSYNPRPNSTANDRHRRRKKTIMNQR